MASLIPYILILAISLLLPTILTQFDLQDYGVILDHKHKAKLHWGTYKPNLYFAMKNRRNSSEVFGLMWGAGLNEKLRHACKMEDNLNYHWEQHNGVDYGSQVIEDRASSLTLNTKFVKREYSSLDKQSWNAYINGTVTIGDRVGNNTTNINRKTVSVYLYFAMENFDVKDKSHFTYNETDVIEAKEDGRRKYGYHIRLGEKTKLVGRSSQVYRKRYNETWRVKQFVSDDLQSRDMSNVDSEYILLNPTNSSPSIRAPNIVVIQLIFDQSFEVYVDFSSTGTNLSLEEIQSQYKLKSDEFNAKFLSTYWDKLSTHQDLQEMSQAALSNILGGIGYFYGKIKINLDATSNAYHKGFRYAVEDKGLFTATPSRSFFARGFLWDEGFHNILISKWDLSLSIDILDSWLSTMSATGWMAREQIRGAEAESTVPLRFITQDKVIANPPTFIFALEEVLTYYKYHSEDKDSKLILSFLKKCFDKFGAWYEWFETYQKSPDRKSYQWHGRNSEYNLASGLDDFPRGMTPNIYERHLDLLTWVTELVKSLRNLSELFDYELVSHFDRIYKKLIGEMNSLHVDDNLYRDYLGPQFKLIDRRPPYLWRGDGRCGPEVTNPLGSEAECNPYSISPCCSEFGWCGNSANHCNCPKCKRSEKLENRKEFSVKENIFNPHVGYVNLFPMFFGLIDITTHEIVFRNTLRILKSDQDLYSNYGIRSLSRKDSLYHTGDDYWRGNIWMNINFLTLRGLYKHYREDKEAMEVYRKIREALIANVFAQWKLDKTFYEQYSDIDGKGLKARPFNGWTSLILNIITEKY